MGELVFGWFVTCVLPVIVCLLFIFLFFFLVFDRLCFVTMALSGHFLYYAGSQKNCK